MVDHLLYIQLVSWPLQQKAASRMSENIEVTIVHCSQNPIRLFRLAEPEAGMNRANGVIQLFQQIFGIVQWPVQKNVDLGRFQNADPVDPLIEFVDKADLFPKLGFRESMRDL